MNILQNRIDSFKNNSVKWPHSDKQHYKPEETFAKAGLYFVRRPKTSDSVRCFLCDVELSNWKPGQSPFNRHSKESPHCALTCLSYPDVNQKAPTVNNKDPQTQPRGTKMRTARLATFNSHNFWPPNKSMLNQNKKYPAASKLADAGFYYSPNFKQEARIKCPYCKLVIEEPDKNTNVLDKHQKLSSGCAFFIPTHNMRATRSRRDTVDSTKSSDTFTTAASDLEDEEPTKQSAPSKRKLEESKGRKTPEPHSKDDSTTPATKRKRKLPTTKIITKSEFTVQPAKSTKRKEPEPTKTIKIVKRKKSVDLLPTISDNSARSSSATKRRHEELKDSSASKQRKTSEVENPDEDSFWNIEKAFVPSTNVRRPAITFGGKPSRMHSARRSEPASVDIFANLKPSLIVKPGDSKRSLSDVHKPVEQKKLSIDAPNSFRPVAEKSTSRPSTDSPKDNAAAVASSTAKKRSLTKSAAINTPTPSSMKELPLKVVTDVRQSSSSSSSVSSSFKSQKSATTDTPISAENVEPVAPVTRLYKDKGKGRAFEYNFTPAPVKKPISLSKSKNKGFIAESSPVLPRVVPTSSTTSTTSSSENNFDKRSSTSSFATAASGRSSATALTSKSQASAIASSTTATSSKSQLAPDASSSSDADAGALKNLFSSPLLSSRKYNISQAHEELVPVIKIKKSTPTSKEQDDTSSKDEEKVDIDIKDKERMDASNKHEEMGDASSKDKEVSHSESIGGSPPPPVLRRTPPSNIRRSPSPVLTPNRPTPSPPPPQSSRNKTPPPSPKSVAQKMLFMQSTPTQTIQRMKFLQSIPTEGAQNRMVSAFDIFGDCPLSPIKPTSNNALQDTPVIHQSGRTRNVIVQEEDGAPQRIRQLSPTREMSISDPAVSAPLDINTIFPVESISEEHKKMKVEDFLQHIIDEKIEEVREHGLKRIQEIEEISDRIKAALQYSAGIQED